MELETFIDRIEYALLLPEVDRKYFLENAARYTPEARQKMVEVLMEHEEEFIDYAEHATDAMHKAMQEKLVKMMSEHGQLHEVEIQEAEVQLEKDLKIIY